MKCIFSISESEFTVRCTHHAVSCPRPIPVSICRDCVLRREIHDVVEIRSSPEGTINFVYVYWHGGAAGDELRWSIRSIESNAMFPHRITVIGDRPSWYDGHFISKPRISSAPRHHGITDQLSKTILMSEHQEVGEHIVWMMDDIYFLRPFGVNDIMQPRAVRHRRSHRNEWQTLKCETIDALKQHGLPTNDYATHSPHYVEKQKLQAVVEKFGLKNRTLIWEILYGNSHCDTPAGIRPWLCRIKERTTKVEFFRRTRSATVVNNSHGAWCSGIRDALAEMYPFAATVEKDGAWPEPPRSPGVDINVKRRPEHLRDRDAYRSHMRAIGVLR